ncbi:MAG: Na/Pi cotransporter family protein [Actinobacteria bacterium]|nr:Na/Pi cotransporter family protein [Actinomycetota bacterium]
MRTGGLHLLAQATTGGDVDVVLVVVTLLGGLALFLHGLDRLTEALRMVAGDRMRGLLARMTGNRFRGLATGIGVTAVIQSSSVTTVLVVGFISGGVMTFAQSLPVIMGANIGTTVTAQIIAFDVGDVALALVAVGFAVSFFARRDRRVIQGRMIMGIGLVFFGMSLMGDAMRPLRDQQGFIDLMAHMEMPLLGLAVGAVFTAVVQASAATTGIVIVLAGQGIIPLEAGLALVIGANIGTAATAMLASIGRPREAVRAAVAHTVFNVAGALVWVFLIGALADLVTSIGGSPARQVANAHTIFNVANTVVFIWFTGPFARLIERLVPDPAGERRFGAKYLDEDLLHTPTLALDRTRLELLHMANRTLTMLTGILDAVLDGDRQDLNDIEAMDDEIDLLHGAITAYLGRVSEHRLSERSTEEMLALLEAANELESIGDIVETNLVMLGLDRIEKDIRVSAGTRALLSDLHRLTVQALELAMMAVTQKNAEAAGQVASMKSTVNSVERSALTHEAERLVADAPMRVDTYRFETDVVSNLKRVFYHTKRIARVAVPRAERPDV